MKKIEAAEYIKCVRAAGAAYVQNQSDFPRAVLEYGVALLKARKACGVENDTEFGRWLAEHKLNKVSANERAALMNLARNRKIARKVLQKTESRSVRLIWENEVRPKAKPGTYPSVGIGRFGSGETTISTETLMLVSGNKRMPMTVRNEIHRIPLLPMHETGNETKRMPISPLVSKAVPERSSAASERRTARETIRQPVWPHPQFETISAGPELRRRSLMWQARDKILDLDDIFGRMAALGVTIDQFAEYLSLDENIPQFSTDPATREEHLRKVRNVLARGREIETKLAALDAEAKPSVKLVN